jgi:hypothetical protein
MVAKAVSAMDGVGRLPDVISELANVLLLLEGSTFNAFGGDIGPPSARWKRPNLQARGYRFRRDAAAAAARRSESGIRTLIAANAEIKQWPGRRAFVVDSPRLDLSLLDGRIASD